MKESSDDVLVLAILMIVFVFAIAYGSKPVESHEMIKEDNMFNKWRRIY